MKNALAAVAALALVASPARAQEQDELDVDLLLLAQRLRREGPSAALADLLQLSSGRKAVRETIDLLVFGRSGRYERDAVGHFEDYLFTRDPAETLALRPERQADADRLRASVARAAKLRDDFGRRVDRWLGAIPEASDLERRYRAVWSDPEFRLALFQRFAEETRDLTPEELFRSSFGHALRPHPGGKLRVAAASRPEVADRVRATCERLDSLAAYEAAFRKWLEAAPDAPLRARAGSEPALLHVSARLAREAAENAERPWGTLAEKEGEHALTLHVDLPAIVAAVEEARALDEALRPLFAEAAERLDGEEIVDIELREFLRNDRARGVVAEALEAEQDARRAKADAFFDAYREDHLEARGDAAAVKAGRFVDENGQASPDALENELRAPIAEFAAFRYPFDALAERCADSSLAALFEDRAATYAIREEVERVRVELTEAARLEGFRLFVDAYLARSGDEYALRPERARKLPGLVRRADQIRKETEEAERAAAEARRESP